MLFQLIYLHIVNVDWWTPSTVKYRLLFSFLLIYFLCLCPYISSFFFVFLFTVQSTPSRMKRTCTLHAVCSNMPASLALRTHLFVIFSENHDSSAGVLLAAALTRPLETCQHVHWKSAMRRLRLCNVSDDAWRNCLSRKMNRIATAVIQFFTFLLIIVYWSTQVSTACCLCEGLWVCLHSHRQGSFIWLFFKLRRLH